MKLRTRGSNYARDIVGVKEHGLYRIMINPIDNVKKQVHEIQRESSLSGSMQVQRENLQPKKSAWSVGSKESCIRKKELWNELK